MKKLSFFQKNCGLTFLIIVALNVQSCKDYLSSPIELSNQVSTVKNTTPNFLTFSSVEEYQKTIEKLSKASHKELEEYERKNQFTSMRTLLKLAENEDAKNHEKEI